MTSQAPASSGMSPGNPNLLGHGLSVVQPGGGNCPRCPELEREIADLQRRLAEHQRLLDDAIASNSQLYQDKAAMDSANHMIKQRLVKAEGDSAIQASFIKDLQTTLAALQAERDSFKFSINAAGVERDRAVVDCKRAEGSFQRAIADKEHQQRQAQDKFNLERADKLRIEKNAQDTTAQKDAEMRRTVGERDQISGALQKIRQEYDDFKKSAVPKATLDDLHRSKNGEIDQMKFKHDQDRIKYSGDCSTILAKEKAKNVAEQQVLQGRIRDLDAKAVQLQAQGSSSTLAQAMQQHNDRISKLNRELTATQEKFRKKEATYSDNLLKCTEDRQILVGKIDVLNKKIKERNASTRQVTEQRELAEQQHAKTKDELRLARATAPSEQRQTFPTGSPSAGPGLVPGTARESLNAASVERYSFLEKRVAEMEAHQASEPRQAEQTRPKVLGARPATGSGQMQMSANPTSATGQRGRGRDPTPASHLLGENGPSARPGLVPGAAGATEEQRAPTGRKSLSQRRHPGGGPDGDDDPDDDGASERSNATTSEGEEEDEAPARQPSPPRRATDQRGIPSHLRESKRVKPFTLSGKFPTIARLKNWKTEFLSRVAAASYRGDDLVVAWLNEVEDRDHDLESLRGNPDAFPWPLLNTCLRDALTTFAGTQGEFAGLLTRKTADEVRVHKCLLNGRQCYYLMLQFFATSDSLSQAYNIADLEKIQYPGDEHLAHFLHTWNNVADNMITEIADEPLAEMLLKRIGKSVELKSDVGQYWRLPLGHKDRTYGFLIGCMNRRVQQERKETNRDRQLQAVADSCKTPAAGAVGAEGSERKGKKGKKETKAKKSKKDKKERDSSDDDAPATPAADRGQGGRGRGGGLTPPPKPTWIPIDPAWKGKSICKKSLVGKCPNGAECQKFHPAESDNMPQGKANICSFFQDSARGCNNRNCPDAHMGVGPEAAEWFVNCRKSERTASREARERKGKGGGKGQGDQSADVCDICNQWKKEGKCTRLDNGGGCKFKHPREMAGRGDGSGR